MNQAAEAEAGRLCLVLQAPYEGEIRFASYSYVISVCSGKLCRVLLAPVQGTDGARLLEARNAHTLDETAIHSHKIDGSLLIDGAREVTNAADYIRSAEVRAHSLFKLQPPIPYDYRGTLLCHVSEANFGIPVMLLDGAWSDTAVTAGLIQDCHVAGWRVIQRQFVKEPGGGEATIGLVAGNARLSDLYSSFGQPTDELTVFLQAVSRWAAAKTALLPPVKAGQLVQKLTYKPSAAAAAPDPIAAHHVAAGVAGGAAAGCLNQFGMPWKAAPHGQSPLIIPDFPPYGCGAAGQYEPIWALRKDEIDRLTAAGAPYPPAAQHVAGAGAAGAAAAGCLLPTQFGVPRKAAPCEVPPLIIPDFSSHGPQAAGQCAATLAAWKRYGAVYGCMVVNSTVYGVRRGPPFNEVLQAIQQHQQQKQQQQQAKQHELEIEFGAFCDNIDLDIWGLEKPLTQVALLLAAAEAGEGQQHNKVRRRASFVTGLAVEQECDADIQEPAAAAAVCSRGFECASPGPVAAGKWKKPETAGEQQLRGAGDQLAAAAAAAAAAAVGAGDDGSVDLTGDDQDAAADLAAAAAAAARTAAAARAPETEDPAVDCPICFDAIGGERALQLGCDHVIHVGSLARYLHNEETYCKDTNQHVCPVCKATATAPPTLAEAVADAAAEGQQQPQQPQQQSQQQPPAGWEIRSNHIAKLTALGVLTAEQEEHINGQQIRRAVGAKHSCIQCNMLLDLYPGPANAPSAYRVKCGACNTQQCVACGELWSAVHKRLTCAQMRALDNNIDPATRLLLANTVVCAGGCGHAITKDESRGDNCNVTACQRCRLYTCLLCGDKLDSSTFDVTDRYHRDVIQHYACEGRPCYAAMWMEKDEWHKRQGGDQAAAAGIKKQQQQQQQQQEDISAEDWLRALDMPVGEQRQPRALLPSEVGGQERQQQQQQEEEQQKDG